MEQAIHDQGHQKVIYPLTIITFISNANTMESLACKYQGDLKNRLFQGKGRYVFSNGSVYEGSFENGEFHGDGVLHIPQKGTFTGKWNKGECVDASIKFPDGLVVSQKEISYCTESDRRIFPEHNTSICCTNSSKQHDIPKDTFDAGDGYYNPETKTIWTYSNSNELRCPSGKEINWLKSRAYQQSKRN